MLVRSIFASYYRLLAGAALALIAISLAGCNDKVAEKATPSRPVLVATVHYEAESPARSFVGTIRPRIETDMGFRVPGKVAKRLVEVGQTVDVGQPLATLDEIDLRLQAEQADAELRASTGVLAQAAAAEQRSKDLRAKGWATDAQLDQAKATADEARARLNRAERSVELTKNSLSYATLVADTRGVVTATLIDAGQVVRNAHLSRKILAARRRRTSLARHDRDADAVRSRDDAGRAVAAVGAVQRRRWSVVLHRRRQGRRDAEAGRGEILREQ
jgi:RND family efflux transporter MFP subunit